MLQARRGFRFSVNDPDKRIRKRGRLQANEAPGLNDQPDSAPATMRPLRVRLFLGGGYAGSTVPTLDAIVAAEIALEHGQVLPPYPTDLPIAQTEEGVHRASQGFLLTDGHVSVMQRYVAAGRMWDAEVRLDRVTGFPGQTTELAKNSGSRGGGPGYELQVRTVELVEFHAVADPEALAPVLENVTAIGQGRQRGYGRVARCEIVEIDADPELWGLVAAGGMPMRPIPVPAWKGGPAPLAICRWKVPYWDTTIAPELCVVAATQSLEDLHDA